MQPLISEIVKESLVNQLGAEKYNANLYLTIAAYLRVKGFDNLAKLFENQHTEEESHALIIYKLLTDLNEDFSMPTIDGFSPMFNSITDVSELYIQREIDTTESLKEIRLQAADEGNGGCPVVEVAMIEILKLQQNELEEAATFNDKCQIIGNDWKTVLLWDASLGA
jgi:ferritin